MRMLLLLLLMSSFALHGQQVQYALYYSQGHLIEDFNLHLEEEFDDYNQHREVISDQVYRLGCDMVKQQSAAIIGLGVNITRMDLHWTAKDGESAAGRYGGSYRGTEREFDINAYGVQPNIIFGVDLLSRMKRASLRLIGKTGFGYMCYTDRNKVTGIDINRKRWTIPGAPSNGYDYRTPYDPDFKTSAWLFNNFRFGLEFGFKDRSSREYSIHAYREWFRELNGPLKKQLSTRLPFWSFGVSVSWEKRKQN